MPFKDKSGRRYPQKTNPVGRRAFPLRKVIGGQYQEIMLADGTGSGVQRFVEVLECGHRQPPVSDIIGETNAQARRCAICAKEPQEHSDDRK
jgi:hypothetical protein